MARDKEDKIVALRWACVVRREDAENDYTFECLSDCWKVNEIQRLLSTVEKKIWKLVPNNIHTLFSWLIISVEQSFTRQGIARQLLEYREDELKNIGCQGLVTTASAYNSQQVGKNFHFISTLF